MTDNKNINPSDGEDKKILISKEKMDAIMKRLGDLEASQDTTKELKPVKNHVARMKIFDGKLVIGFKGKHWMKYDEKERVDKLWCTLLMIDNKKKESTKKVIYNDFLEQSEEELAEIIKQEVEMHEENLGTVEAKEIQGFTMVGNGNEVDVIVATPITTATIKVKGYEEMDVSVDSLNL